MANEASLEDLFISEALVRALVLELCHRLLLASAG